MSHFKAFDTKGGTTSWSRDVSKYLRLFNFFFCGTIANRLSFSWTSTTLRSCVISLLTYIIKENNFRILPNYSFLFCQLFLIYLTIGKILKS